MDDLGPVQPIEDAGETHGEFEAESNTLPFDQQDFTCRPQSVIGKHQIFGVTVAQMRQRR